MDATNLIAYLPFDTSTTEDFCGGTWAATGSPTIQDGKLTLDGSSYIRRAETFTLNKQPFTVSCKFSGTANTTGGAVCLWQMYYSSSYRFQVGITTAGILNLWKDSDSTIGIKTTASVLDGQVHHVEASFDGATWRLFVDGALIGSKNHSPANRTYTLYVGTNYSTNKQFTGTIDEFMIFDGVALHTEDFTPPTDEDYAALKSSAIPYRAEFDVECRIKNPLLTWRYENPGIAEILTTGGTTLTNLPESQSRTDCAFYQTTRAKCFDLPATSEVWLKFDVFFDGSNRWRAYNGGNNGTTGVTAQTTGGLSYFANGATVSPNGANIAGICIANRLQTVLLHMTAGSSAGVVEAWVDGTLIYSYFGDVNHGSDFADLYLQSDGAGTFFSNVIISNAQIGFDDVVSDTWGSDVEISFDVETRIRNNPVIDEEHPAQLYFNGSSRNYATIPVGVLGGMTEFTVEVKFSTTSTATSNNSMGYLWRTIIGRDVSTDDTDEFSLAVNGGKLCCWLRIYSRRREYFLKPGVTVNDGQIHIAAVRGNADGSVDLFCDGVIVDHIDGVNYSFSSTAPLCVATNTANNSALRMNFYEARLWNSAREEIWSDIDGTEENLRAWYLPSPTGLFDYSPNAFHATIDGTVTYSNLYTLAADVEYQTVNDSLAWRYEDCAIYFGTGAPINFHVPKTPEIWARFDVYFDGVARWYAYDSTNVTGITAQTSLALDFLSADSTVKTLPDVCRAKVTQTFLVHMISGGVDGLIEVWCGLDKLETFTGNVNDGKLFGDFILRSDDIGTSFTELIVSNNPIQPDEKPSNAVRKSKTSQLFETNTKTERIYFEKGGVCPQSHIDIKISDIVRKTVIVGGEGEFSPVKSIWIKFDVLFDGEHSWWAYSDGPAGICGIIALTTGDIDISANGTVARQMTGICAANRWQNFIVHMESDPSDGLIEIWTDGVLTLVYTGNVNDGNEFTDIFLGADSDDGIFRDFILSTAELTADSITRDVASAPTLKLNVRHQGKIISVPLTLSAAPITPAFAVRWAGCNWYNPLVASSAVNATATKIWHNGTEFALSTDGDSDSDSEDIAADAAINDGWADGDIDSDAANIVDDMWDDSEVTQTDDGWNDFLNDIFP